MQEKRKNDTPIDSSVEKKQRTNQVPDPPPVIRVSLGKQPPVTPLQLVNGRYSLDVGHYFTLEALVNGVPQPATWQVAQPNDLVKQYNPTIAHAAIERHTLQDMNATTFTGVWWKAGDKIITLRVQNQSFSISFRVTSPMLDDQMAQFGEAIKIGQVEVGKFSIPREEPAREWLILVGNSGPDRQLHGIDISYDIIQQQPGKVAFIQIVKTARQAKHREGGKVELLQSDAWLLDNWQNSDTYTYQNRQTDLSVSTQISINDGPGLQLGDAMDQQQISEQFRTFIMFRPAGPEAETTWVPLDELSWEWKGEAQYQHNTWVLVRKNAPRPAQPNCGFPPNTDPDLAFPQWNADTHSLNWRDVASWVALF